MHTGLDESATSLFVLPINEQQDVSLASLVNAPDPVARPGVRSRPVTGRINRPIDPEDITSNLRGAHHNIGCGEPLRACEWQKQTHRGMQGRCRQPWRV